MTAADIAVTVKGRKSEEGVFIPLSPVLETGAVLVWKKSQIFMPATAAFPEYLKNAEKA